MRESKFIADRTVLLHEGFQDWSEVADNGGVRSGTPTISNGVLSLVSGTNDKISLPKINLSGKNKVSIKLKFYFTNGLTLTSFEQYTDINNRICVFKYTDNKLYFIIANGGNANGGVVLSGSTWYDVVCVYDGTGAANADRCKIYVNGINQTLTFSGTIPATIPNFTSRPYIGYYGVTGIYSDGKLDSCTIYNRALTANEVSALYCNNLYIPPTSLIEILSINNILGTIVDRWGNTITNTAVTTPRRGDIYTMGFDGTTSKLVANTVTTTGMLGATTGILAAWINLDTIATTPQIIDFGDTDADTRIQFDVFNTGYLRALVAITGTTYWALDTDSAVIGTTKWIHVGLVQDGTSPVLYVNGVAIAQAFSTSTDKTKWFSAMSGLDNFRIGCGNWNSGGDTNYLKGLVSQPIVVKDAYSSLQMARLYNSQKRLYGL